MSAFFEINNRHIIDKIQELSRGHVGKVQVLALIFTETAIKEKELEVLEILKDSLELTKHLFGQEAYDDFIKYFFLTLMKTFSEYKNQLVTIRKENFAKKFPKNEIIQNMLTEKTKEKKPKLKEDITVQYIGTFTCPDCDKTMEIGTQHLYDCVPGKKHIQTIKRRI